MMTPIPIDGPAVEPIGMPDMRAYLRLDDGAEDDLIAALVKTARVHVEAAAGRVLVESRWRMGLDAWPEGRVVPLPVSPLIAVERVRVFDRDGGAIDVPAGLYEADPFSDPPRLVVDPLAPEPGRRRQGVLIEVRAGYGATPESVPAPLRQAVRLLVARWFENRGDADPGPLPPDVLALVAPFRRMRI
jgi:uncharacterized phiE125 gp8 family phage protein